MTKTAIEKLLQREIERVGGDTPIVRLWDHWAKKLAEIKAFVENDNKRFLVEDFICYEVTLADLHDAICSIDAYPSEWLPIFRQMKKGKFHYKHPIIKRTEDNVEKKKEYEQFCEEHKDEIRKREEELNRQFSEYQKLFYRSLF